MGAITSRMEDAPTSTSPARKAWHGMLHEKRLGSHAAAESTAASREQPSKPAHKPNTAPHSQGRATRVSGPRHTGTSAV